MQHCCCFDVVVRREKKLLFKLPRDQRWGHVNSGAHHHYAAWWPWLNDIDIDISIYTYNVQRITTEISWRGRPTTSLPFLSLYVNYSTNHPTNHRNPPLPPFDSEINRKPYKKQLHFHLLKFYSYSTYLEKSQHSSSRWMVSVASWTPRWQNHGRSGTVVVSAHHRWSHHWSCHHRCRHHRCRSLGVNWHRLHRCRVVLTR